MVVVDDSLLIAIAAICVLFMDAVLSFILNFFDTWYVLCATVRCTISLSGYASQIAMLLFVIYTFLLEKTVTIA